MRSTGELMMQQPVIQQQLQQQRALMHEQHRLELEHIERAHALRQQSSPPRPPATASKPDGVREAAVEQAHLGWRDLIKSAPFHEWYDRQPPSIQRLGASARVEDAILVLDIYKNR
jgi:hypothetical protein